ncbi:hypothetical protein Tco_0843966 [Tanacetum coccineum]
MIDHLIRRIHQLDTTYQTFYPEQHIEFYSLNDASIFPNIRWEHPTDNLFLVSGNHLMRAMTDVTTEFIIRETLEKDVTNSNSKLTETWIDLDKLCMKIFKDLWGINDSEDDTVSSNEEWEEHEYGNPPNNSLPKPYLNTNDKRDKNYHKENNGDTNKSGDMVLSGAPYSEELTYV